MLTRRKNMMFHVVMFYAVVSKKRVQDAVFGAVPFTAIVSADEINVTIKSVALVMSLVARVLGLIVMIDETGMMVAMMMDGTGRYPAAQCALGIAPTVGTAIVTMWAMAVSTCVSDRKTAVVIRKVKRAARSTTRTSIP